jgi:hypothetical protein
MGLRLREGRFFDDRDRMDAPPAMIVNRRFTELYLKGRPAIGTHVRIGGANANRPQYTIVGIVDNVKHNGLTREVKAQFYAPQPQFATNPGNTSRSMTLVVRGTGDPMRLVAPVRSAIRSLDPRVPVSEVRSMTDVVEQAIAAPRFAMQLLGLFGVLALVLSAIGICTNHKPMVLRDIYTHREGRRGLTPHTHASPSLPPFHTIHLYNKCHYIRGGGGGVRGGVVRSNQKERV